MNIKERLKNYRYNKIELQQLRDRIDELEIKLNSTSPKFSFSSKSTNVQNDEMIMKHLELIEMWNEKRSELLIEQAQMETFVNSIENPLDRIILRSRYIDIMPMWKCGIKANCSEREVYRRIKKFFQDEKATPG